MRRLRKLLALLAGWLLALPAFADSITIPYSFTAGETITAAKFNSNFSAITTVVNGNLDDNNIKVGASIATSKLNLTAEMPVLRSAGNRCLSAGVTGDTVPRVSLTSSGPITFGAGSASAHDMGIKREDASTIAIRDAGDSAYRDFKARAGTFSGALSADSLTLTTPYSVAINLAQTNGGRLTLTSGTPVTTSDVTAAGTIYWEPYKSDQIALWTGSAYQVYSIGSNKSLALTVTSGSNYDIFGYLNAGTLALESLVWTSTTARATAVVRDATGVLTKSDDRTRRYLGTIYATASNQTEDSLSRRCVFNADNRVMRPLRAVDGTNTWTYSTTSFRNFNGSSTDGTGQCRFVIGVSEAPLRARADLMATTTGNDYVYVGVGIDGTTNNAQIVVPAFYSVYMGLGRGHAIYQGFPGIGMHTVAPLEKSTGSTATVYGDNGAASDSQSGLQAFIEG